MHRLLANLGLALGCALSTGSGCAPSSALDTAIDDGWSRFGRAGGDEADPGRVPTVAVGALGDNTTAAGEQVVVDGIVHEVCQAKGCWLTLKNPGGDDVLVRFRDYSFFVPRNATGRKAVIVGVSETVTLSADALRHLAQDAGKSPSEINAITAPRTKVTLIADAVWIQGPGLADPYRPVGVESCPPVDVGTAP